MRITVAICTWNRCNLLRKTLERLAHCSHPPPGQWEVVVVNNNSTDDTAAVAESFEDKLPLRVLLETELGLSNARNTALSAARGEYVIWTDDDVLVDENWLPRYVAAFAEYPDAEFFGGTIEPWFEDQPPAWLRETVDLTEGAYAIRQQGSEVFRIGRGTLPFGANMVLRRNAVPENAFDPTLGRQGKGMLSGEESKLFLSMVDRGGEGWWIPDARVRHFIPRSRQTTKHLRSYFFGHGYGKELLNPSTGDGAVGAVPRWMWRQTLQASVRYAAFRAVLRPRQWVAALRDASIAWGRIAAIRDRAREKEICDNAFDEQGC